METDKFDKYWVAKPHIERGVECILVSYQTIGSYYPDRADSEYLVFMTLTLPDLIDNDGYLNMTLGEISDRVMLSTRRVSKIINRLCEDGHLVKIRRSKYQVVGWYPDPYEIMRAQEDQLKRDVQGEV